MKIKLPNVDDTGSTFGELYETKFGFRASSLRGLYLMTGQFSNGASVSSTVVNDSSGLGNHGTLQTGTTAVQRSFGYEVGSPGGGFTTPVAVQPSYTQIFVGRQRFSEGDTPARFPAYALPSSALAGSTSSPNSAAANGIYITQTVLNTFVNKLDLGLYANSNIFPGSAGRVANTREMVRATNYFAIAVSVDATNNVVEFRSSAGSMTFASSAVLGNAGSATGNHAFGVFRLDTYNLTGDICLAAVHNIAFTGDALQNELDNAVRIVRQRGVPVA